MAYTTRIDKEKLTMRRMTRIYCRDCCGDVVRTDGLCPACNELVGYAEARLDRCVYGERKSTCRLCPIHCYRPQMRERMRAVMRYAGPRMLRLHPVDALRHLWQERINPRPFPAAGNPKKR
jgi:predicted amidophosphoribosyltransferase